MYLCTNALLPNEVALFLLPLEVFVNFNFPCCLVFCVSTSECLLRFAYDCRSFMKPPSTLDRFCELRCPVVYVMKDGYAQHRVYLDETTVTTVCRITDTPVPLLVAWRMAIAGGLPATKYIKVVFHRSNSRKYWESSLSGACCITSAAWILLLLSQRLIIASAFRVNCHCWTDMQPTISWLQHADASEPAARMHVVRGTTRSCRIL